MILLLYIAITLAAANSTSEEAALNRLVHDSTICLSEGVKQHIPPSKMAISEDERQIVRIAVARKCESYNDSLARLISDLRSGVTTDQARNTMRVMNLRLTDGIIMHRLQLNAENGSVDAED